MTLFYDFIRYGPLFRRWLTGQCQSPCTRVPASASSTLDYSRQELTGQSQPTNKGLMNRRADSRDACTTIPFRSDGRSFVRSPNFLIVLVSDAMRSGDNSPRCADAVEIRKAIFAEVSRSSRRIVTASGGRGCDPRVFSFFLPFLYTNPTPT